MKAVVFEKLGGPEVMKIAEVPKPEVKPGSVLIKVRAAGINFADTLFRQGQYLMQPNLPDTPGLEAAGEIEAVGAGVANLKQGQRVAALGSKMYAEYALAPAAQVIPIPDSISFEHAAAFPVQVLTAWHMLHTSHQTGPGQTVLVHSAAGGVGIVAVQIAKAAGARVIGTVSSASKAALIKEYGADDAINYVDRRFRSRGEPPYRRTRRRSDPGCGRRDHVGERSDVSRSVRTSDSLRTRRRSARTAQPVQAVREIDQGERLHVYTVAAVPDAMRRGIEESFKLIAAGQS